MGRTSHFRTFGCSPTGNILHLIIVPIKELTFYVWVSKNITYAIILRLELANGIMVFIPAYVFHVTCTEENKITPHWLAYCGNFFF